MSLANSNICFIFNRIYLNLMKDIKNKSSDIKAILKKNYKVFDKKSYEYIDSFIVNINDDIIKVVFSENDIVDNISVLNMELFQDITVNDIMKKIVENNVDSLNTVRYYIYLLMVLAYMYRMDDVDDDKKAILLQKTLYIINNVDKNDIDNESMEKHLEDIIDDDIKKILWKMFLDKKNVKEPVMNMDDNFESMEFLHNTKIGELAKEISQSIDVESLNISSPEELLDINNVMNSSNNPLGNIIQTVGTKITEKISKGEINQEELMSEALNMMSTLNMSGQGDIMSQMMNMMNNNNPTKERLRKKLENKKK